jgi:hypothetical protein
MASSAHHGHWICEEAAMAAINFNTAHQKEHARQQLKIALTAIREMLDAFVSNRMRQVATDTPRQAPRHSTATLERGGERQPISPADQPATVTAPFRRLDPDILNETIPAFFVGRNREGFWVARDVNGRIGGIFLLENSALSFARRNSGAAGCATIYLSERFELDLKNQGNLLVVRLGSWKRLAKHLRQRLTAFIGNIRPLSKDG